MTDTYRITAVRVEATSGDDSHEHVTRVRIGFDAGAGLSRDALVAQLSSSSGDRYDTFANGELAPVVLATCPACQAADYVTTRATHAGGNNLLELPRF
jgi:hypothetical protein